VGSSEAHLVGLYIPLRVRDELTGVLEAYGNETLAEEQPVGTLISLTSQAASALENGRLYGELAERGRQLRDLVGRLLVAQEEERRRLAYEIHDGLTQIAVATYQHLQAFADEHPPDSARAQEQLEQTLELAQQTVVEARRVIAGLRPTMLDDFGLASAIRLQVEELRSEGCQVNYEEKLGDERLPVELETALFRVAQEALTNVRKHAQSTQVDVVLERLEGGIRLQVKDRGRGFRPTEVSNGGGPGERVGLSSMRERVTLLGGELEVRSEPGKGTIVVADVPLPTYEEEDADHEE
jgi:signal transduction histidine kinase